MTLYLNDMPTWAAAAVVLSVVGGLVLGAFLAWVIVRRGGMA